MNTKQWVQEHRIRIETEQVSENPNAPTWEANHYKVVLRRGRKQLTTYFSTGFGLRGEPTATDVLDCLARDAASVECGSFEEWAADLGYDPDSRKAEALFRVCERQTEALRRFLGDGLLRDLMFNTERP